MQPKPVRTLRNTNCHTYAACAAPPPPGRTFVARGGSMGRKWPRRHPHLLSAPAAWVAYARHAPSVRPGRPSNRFVTAITLQRWWCARPQLAPFSSTITNHFGAALETPIMLQTPLMRHTANPGVAKI